MNRLVEVTSENRPLYLGPVCRIEEGTSLSPWSRVQFEEEIGNPLSRLWVLLSDESAVGFICFWLVRDEIQLLKIAVLPGFRGRGFGRLLMNEMIDWGISRGARAAWLEVSPSNSVALRLYRDCGFQEVGRRPNYYTETGEDAVLMSLVFNQPVAKEEEDVFESSC